MNKTIAVIGSSRRKGNTGKLLDSIVTELGIEVVDLSTKNISPYDYEHKNSDDVFLSFDELKEQGRELRTKVGYVVCTSISANVDDSFIDSFTNTFKYLSMEVGAYIHVDCNDGFEPDQCQVDVIDFIKKLRCSNE